MKSAKKKNERLNSFPLVDDAATVTTKVLETGKGIDIQFNEIGEAIRVATNKGAGFLTIPYGVADDVKEALEYRGYKVDFIDAGTRISWTKD